MTRRSHSAWSIVRNGRTLYEDDPAHVALVLRTLQIDEATWRQVLARYAALARPPADLEALTDAYAACSPHEKPLPSHIGTSRCPACDSENVLPVVARRSLGPLPTIFGRCQSCGHGKQLFLSHPAAYVDEIYYQTRSANGVGYDGYEREREYREAKGERFLRWVLARSDPPPRTMLEVGAGFGFTRRAAERLGLRTFGIDVNPAAANGAMGLYGYETFVGTLEAARTMGAAPAADLVVYQFVLEHVLDLAHELAIAHAVLTPRGYLALCVPNMEAVERFTFGASYRSFRDDHLHLFSVASAKAILERAGLVMVAGQTECNVHLLRGFLRPEALAALYARGKGPDHLFLARRRE